MGRRVADEGCSMMTPLTPSHLPDYMVVLIQHGAGDQRMSVVQT